MLPGYLQSPAPFGIGAYGIKNVSGTLVPYSYSTSGFSTTLNITSLAPFDVNSYDPNAVSIQLNTVLANTTILGVGGYTYWTQNVLFYDNYAHYFEMVDNIWNFSSPTAAMPPGTIASHTAFQEPYPSAYIGVGPIISNVSAPFVATLSLESALIGGYDTVFFNYSLTFTNTSTHLKTTVGGVFDEVQFNTPTGVLGYVSPPAPLFRVDGGNVTPTGYIPYDAEVGIIGPGGGSNINIQSINGTMQLLYKNATGKYVNVPSAYDIGSETGETSSGIAVAWQPSGNVTLTSGPSLFEGMWNVSAYTGSTHYTGLVSPSNAFMFVGTGGSMNLGNYGYVPLSASGAYSFWLPTGSYYQETMMSYHAVNQGTLTATESITLATDAALGVYTPLYAMDNTQLANLSLSGSGTLTSPYLLYNNEPGYINGLFGEFNDFGFTVFSGVMIANTNAYADLNNTPSFSISYDNVQTLFYLRFFIMPSVDYLGFVLYNTSGLSIYGANLVTGALPANYFAGFYGANLILWNSTGDLIANSTFIASPYFIGGASVLVYNPANVFSGNVFFGNYFLPGEVGFFDAAIIIASSGNLIYNNYFNDFPNVFQETADIYTGASPVSYANGWNIPTSIPASSVSLVVNGYSLSGSIVGNSTVGGNYWNDYVPGTSLLPFSDLGSIITGGDSLPVVLPGPYYPVVFEQTSLPSGHMWSVTMGGVTKTSTSSTIVFNAEIGSYNYTIQTTGQYVLFGRGQGTVSVFVNGLSAMSSGVAVLFLPYYTITVNEQGLPAGFVWAAYAGSGAAVISSAASSTNQVILPMVPGMWDVADQAIGSYFGFPDSDSYTGSVTTIVLNSNSTVYLNFTPVFIPFPITLSGASALSTWNITVYLLLNTGPVPMGTYQATGSSLILMLPYGHYQFIFNSSSLVLLDSTSNAFDVSFFPYPYYPSALSLYVAEGAPVTFVVSNQPAGTAWQILLELEDPNFYWYTQYGTTSSSLTVLVPMQSVMLFEIASSNSSYTSFTNTIVVNGPETVNVQLALVSSSHVTVTFTETGLASGTQWQVTLNGQTQTSTASSITFTTSPGNQYYQVYSNGSTTPQSSGSLNVQGQMTVAVQFTPVTYSITFIAAGLPSGQALTVTFNGKTSSAASGAVLFSAAAGTYTYSVGNVSGYKLASSSSSVTVGHNTIVLLQFQSTKGTTPSSALSPALNDTLFVVIGLVIGGLAGFVGLRYLQKRKKGGQ